MGPIILKLNKFLINKLIIKTSSNENEDISNSKLLNKSVSKRVSICGNIFSENVLQIDDTILDEYENDLDYKSGKLISFNQTKKLEENSEKEEEEEKEIDSYNNQLDKSKKEIERDAKPPRKRRSVCIVNEI